MFYYSSNALVLDKYFDKSQIINSGKIIGKFIKKYNLKDEVNIITKIPKLKRNQNPINQIINRLKIH